MGSDLMYYAAANSCCGYVSFLNEYAGGMKIICLKNATEECKAHLKGRLRHCETILRAGTEESAEGFLLRDKGVLILDSDFGGGVGKIFDFAPEYFAEVDCSPLRDMYAELSEAKKIHDEWEKIYISQTDFTAADGLLRRVTSHFNKGNGEAEGCNVNRFFGTMTENGSVNYINELTRGFRKRIFIKGRPGSGKSTLMKKVGEAARSRGLDTETYYCSFDPASLDMVVVRELGFCIFDATPPHELFPKLPSDETLDMYALCINHATDRRFATEIAGISARYAEKIRAARECLARANRNRAAALESIPKDDGLRDSVTEEIICEINR